MLEWSIFGGMEKKVRLLKVGDVVYETRYGNLIARHTVDRVTDKRAYVSGNCFKREVTSGHIREIGRNTYSTTYFYLPTPDFDAKWRDMQKAFLKSKSIGRMNEGFKALSLEDILKVEAFVKGLSDGK